jgi:hypothetical protein
VLWEVLDNFPVSLKRQFLAFVTGISRLPAVGTEVNELFGVFHNGHRLIMC